MPSLQGAFAVVTHEPGSGLLEIVIDDPAIGQRQVGDEMMRADHRRTGRSATGALTCGTRCSRPGPIHDPFTAMSVRL